MKWSILPLLGVAALAQSNPQNASLVVDFGQPVTTVSESGFVAGADPVNPPYPMISPLRPNFWAVSGMFPFNDPAPPAESYNRAHQFTSNLMVTAGDLWGYPTGSPPPPPSEYPYQDWPKWQSLLQQSAQSNATRNLMWGIWNEPDNPALWPGSQQQFFDTYAHAYSTLRQTLGAGVLIGGPQISSYDKTYITAFLDYALANNLQVNFLAWHEISTSDTGIAAIASDLKDARASFLQNPKYAPLKIQKIFIDRSVGIVSNHKPGDALGYLYYLEQGHADGAAKACWADSRQASECFNNTMDGLLTTQYVPRAEWWAYKGYADGVATRVASSTTDYRVVALASSSGISASTAQVLVGYFNTAGTAAVSVPVNLNLTNLGSLSFLQGKTQVRLTLELIPSSDEVPITQLTTADDVIVPIQNGSAQTTIPPVHPGDAYRITVAAPPTGAPPSAAAVVNAASFINQPVAPGSIVTIFGSNLALDTFAQPTYPLPTTLKGVSVIVNDIALPLFYVSPTQINAQLPYATSIGNASLVVRSPSNLGSPLTFNVIPASPGIFLANGQAVSQTTGNVITVYMTGQGPLDNPVADGAASPGTPLARAVLDASATINGVPATVQFLGLTPGFAGLLQANILVPNNIRGQALLIVTVGGVESNPALVTIN